MRRFLYSKWFFLVLAAVCAVDLIADLGEHFWGETVLNLVAIAMDAIALSFSAWIFTDLHIRRPRSGDNTRSRR
jgi:hypothetical protein